MARSRSILLVALLLGLSTLFLTDAVSAQEVLVVTSKDLGPYNMAFNGFRGSYKGKYDTVSVDEVPGLSKSSVPDVIVTIGGNAVKASLQLPPRIPMVILMALKINEKELQNRSYVAINPFLSAERHISFIEKNFSSLSPVGIITSDPDVASLLRRFSGTIKVEVAEIKKMDQVPKISQSFFRKVSSLLLLPDPNVLNKETFEFLLLKSFEAGIPIFTYSEALVKRGAFIGLAAGYEDIGSQAAKLLQKGATALKGRKDILQPDTISIYINENTARTLKLNIPSEVKDHSLTVK